MSRVARGIAGWGALLLAASGALACSRPNANASATTATDAARPALRASAPAKPQARGTPAPPEGQPAWIEVRGIVAGSHAEIDALAWVHEGSQRDAEPLGDARVVARDGHGRELVSAAAQRDPEDRARTRYRARLPVRAQIVRVELLVSGALRASRSAPRVVITPAQPMRADGSIDFAALRWRGSDPDGDPLTYTVEWSADDGLTWALLELASTAEQLARPFQLDTPQGLLRVTATDGFFVHAAQSASIATPRRPNDRQPYRPPGRTTARRQFIPLDGTRYALDDRVELNATGLELERVYWLSDRRGWLGGGAVPWPGITQLGHKDARLSLPARSLGPGPHTLTAVFVDPAGGPPRREDATIHVGEPDVLVVLAQVATPGRARGERGRIASFALTLHNRGARPSAAELTVRTKLEYTTLVEVGGGAWSCDAGSPSAPVERGRIGPLRCRLLASPLAPGQRSPPLDIRVEDSGTLARFPLRFELDDPWARDPAAAVSGMPVPDFDRLWQRPLAAVADAQPAAAYDPDASLVMAQGGRIESALVLESFPSGADVVLDGRPVGRTPLRMSGLSPVMHRLSLRLPQTASTEDVALATSSGRVLRALVDLTGQERGDRAMPLRYIDLLAETAVERNAVAVCDLASPLVHLHGSSARDRFRDECLLAVALRRNADPLANGTNELLKRALREHNPDLCATFRCGHDCCGQCDERQGRDRCFEGYARYMADPQACPEAKRGSEHQSAQCLYDVQLERGRFRAELCERMDEGRHRARCVGASAGRAARQRCAERYGDRPGLLRICESGWPELPGQSAVP